MSRSEWIVLSVVCEGPTHGNAVSRACGPDGELGQIWHVQRGVVYRSLDRLSDLGLIRSAGQEFSHQGPVRLRVEATDAGQEAAWHGSSSRSSTCATSGLNCWSSWPC